MTVLEVDLVPTAIAAVAAFSWAFLLGVALLSQRFRITRSDLAGSASVSVIIPARNEAANIGAAIAHIRLQRMQPLELIVVDDASTDGTAQRALEADAAVTVVGIEEGPPDGWLGKPFACALGAARAGGDWLLFVDADVRLDSEFLASLLAHAQASGADLVSGIGTIEAQTIAEYLIQPAVFELILSGRPPGLSRRPMAVGHAMLVRADSYRAAGGHGAVAADVAEDAALASALAGTGRRTDWRWLGDLYRVRMYSGAREVWRGWRKNLYAGLDGRPWRVVVTAALISALTLVPALGLAWSVAIGVPLPVLAGLLATVALMHGYSALIARQLGIPLWRTLLFLPGQLVLLLLLVDSAWHSARGHASWKDRRLPAVNSAGMRVSDGTQS